MSKFQRLGLFSRLRPASPKVSPRGAANAAAFPSAGPKLFGLFAPTGAGPWMSPTTSGKEETEEIPPATPALSGTEIPRAPYPLLITVNGVPLCTVVTPESAQPESRSRCRPRRRSPPKRAPSGGGSSLAHARTRFESNLELGSVQV